MVGWQHRLDGHEFLVNPQELPLSGNSQLAAALCGPSIAPMNARPLASSPPWRAELRLLEADKGNSPAPTPPRPTSSKAAFSQRSGLLCLIHLPGHSLECRFLGLSGYLNSLSSCHVCYHMRRKYSGFSFPFQNIPLLPPNGRKELS